MENVILCNGSYAQTPYFLEEENLHLYSVEELCYFLYKNAFLIQEDFFSDDLLAWITDQLHLEEWSEQLLKLRRNGEPLAASIEFLFQASGYYGEEEIQRVRSVLKNNDHLSVAERKKIRADAYYKKRRYLKAAAEYELLLKEVPSDQVRFRAKLYHDLGVCQAAMFFYDKAADHFLQAYRCYPNTESYVQFLAALKLGNSQEDYLDYLSSHAESYEDSLEVESRLTHIGQQWEKMSFDEMIEARMEESDMNYYDLIMELLLQTKEEYLKMVDTR